MKTLKGWFVNLLSENDWLTQSSLLSEIKAILTGMQEALQTTLEEISSKQTCVDDSVADMKERLTKIWSGLDYFSCESIRMLSDIRSGAMHSGGSLYNEEGGWPVSSNSEEEINDSEEDADEDGDSGFDNGGAVTFT